MREAMYIPTENQFVKAPFGLPEYRACDDRRTTVRPVFGQALRTRLDLVKPNLQMKVMKRQIDQAGAEEHSPTRQLSIGQTVMVFNQISIINIISTI